MKPTLSLNHISFTGKAPDHQPCKFGGKELDAMYTNPKTLSGKDSYAVPPVNSLDYAAFLHDKAYDRHDAKGIEGALFNKSVIKADIALTSAALYDFATHLSISKRSAWALGTALAFQRIINTKISTRNPILLFH